jgi:DNA-binding protein H-NS
MVSAKKGKLAMPDDPSDWPACPAKKSGRKFGRNVYTAAPVAAPFRICIRLANGAYSASDGETTEKEIMPRTASLKIVERKIRELEAKAEALKQKEKPGIKQLKGVLVKYRLTRSDVDLVLNGRVRRGGGSKLAGRKLKPKYRNPANKSETWSGRGLHPKWLIAAMKATNKKLEHFAI